MPVSRASTRGRYSRIVGVTDGMLSMTSVSFSWRSQPASGCRGWLFIAQGRTHRFMTFEVDEKAYLRVTPLKGTHHFGIKGKLAPRYIGPFRILA